MIFTLEALKAENGDSLILHYGTSDAPRFILIDGGPTSSGYRKVIRKRLDQIKDRWHPGQDAQLPLEMMMVSHIDDDHIDGLLALTADLLTRKAEKKPLPYVIRTLWFNSFDDLLNNDDEEIFSQLTASVRAAGTGLPLPGFASADRYGAAVVASVGQGRQLRKDADGLVIPLNAPFKGLIMVSDDPVARRLDFGDGLKFTILAPDQARVRVLQKKWREDVKKHPSAETLAEIASAGGRDTSVANLSSIVVLAEVAGKRMLLTGDALDDDIVAGLDSAGLIQGGKCHVDILKLPHHGSDRNVSKKFFQTVSADHYVASGDGKHGNPEIRTLQWLEGSRGANDDYRIHLTYRRGEEGFGERLDKHLKATDPKRYSFPPDDKLSLKVDLLDPVAF